MTDQWTFDETKYKGHTGIGTWYGDNEIEQISECGADTRLIADAPLILAECVRLRQEADDMSHLCAQYINERDKLQAIVDRLPVDKNGGPVLIGEMYERPGKGRAAGIIVEGFAWVGGPTGFHMGEPDCDPSDFVGSTWADCVPKEAAEAARKEQGDGRS